jgi:hypothetical protein
MARAGRGQLYNKETGAEHGPNRDRYRARLRTRGHTQRLLFLDVGAAAGVLIVGFAPSLYLRAFFDVPPIAGYLHVHGAVVTSWFVWLVLQTSMVRTGRTATHRRLGVIGAVIAVLVVFAGPMATVGAGEWECSSRGRSRSN